MVCYDVVHIRSYEIENSFSRLKFFNILTLPFRGELDRVHVIAQVCAQLVNVDLEFRPLRRSSKEERIKECESFEIRLPTIQEIEVRESRNRVLNELTIGTRISVWFEDCSKSFRGSVVAIMGNERYEIAWENKSEANEIVHLQYQNCTKDPSNTERWWRIKSKK